MTAQPRRRRRSRRLVSDQPTAREDTSRCSPMDCTRRHIVRARGASTRAWRPEHGTREPQQSSNEDAAAAGRPPPHFRWLSAGCPLVKAVVRTMHPLRPLGDCPRVRIGYCRCSHTGWSHTEGGEEHWPLGRPTRPCTPARASRLIGSIAVRSAMLPRRGPPAVRGWAGRKTGRLPLDGCDSAAAGSAPESGGGSARTTTTADVLSRRRPKKKTV